MPWLVAEGREISASSTNPAVHVRARQFTNSSAGLVLAINPTPRPVQTELLLGVGAGIKLRSLFDQSREVAGSGKIVLPLLPYESFACTWGSEPKVQLANFKDQQEQQ